MWIWLSVPIASFPLMSTGNYQDHRGAFFHVFDRGARKDLIYFDDDDRRLWLQVVTSALQRRGCAIHAICMMGNHFHVLVESSGLLSDAMRDALSVYVRRFNLRHGFDGPLHRSRFGRTLVQTDDQFLTVSRYIHRNPLDIFDGPLETYQWSSYRWLLDPGSAPAWMQTDFTLALMGEDPERYRRFVEGPDAPEPSGSIASQPALDSPFLLRDVVEAVAAAAQVRVADLRAGKPGVRNPARLAVCVLANERTISPSAVAEALSYGSGDSVRTLARRARERLERDPAFRQLVDRARTILFYELDQRAA